jgi:hypothetical protein
MVVVGLHMRHMSAFPMVLISRKHEDPSPAGPVKRLPLGAAGANAASITNGLNVPRRDSCMFPPINYYTLTTPACLVLNIVLLDSIKITDAANGN